MCNLQWTLNQKNKDTVELKVSFQLVEPEKKSNDYFCSVLKERLQYQQSNNMMKHMKDFLVTCVSEDLLANREMTYGGMGLKYGFIETRKK